MAKTLLDYLIPKPRMQDGLLLRLRIAPSEITNITACSDDGLGCHDRMPCIDNPCLEGIEKVTIQLTSQSGLEYSSILEVGVLKKLMKAYGQSCPGSMIGAQVLGVFENGGFLGYLPLKLQYSTKNER